MESLNIMPPAADWYVANWSVTVREVLGKTALLKFRCASAVVLAPSVFLTGYALWSLRPALLIWPLLGFWGFGTASTRPTGIGAFGNLILAIVGGTVAFINQDRLFMACGLLPGATWIASCVVLGVTASYLLDVLEKSPELAADLSTRGNLRPVTTDRMERPDDSPCVAD